MLLVLARVAALPLASQAVESREAVLLLLRLRRDPGWHRVSAHDVVREFFVLPKREPLDFSIEEPATLPVPATVTPYRISLCKTHAAWWSDSVPTSAWDYMNEGLQRLFPAPRGFVWHNVHGPAEFVGYARCSRCSLKRSYWVSFTHAETEGVAKHTADIKCEEMRREHERWCSGRPDGLKPGERYHE